MGQFLIIKTIFKFHCGTRVTLIKFNFETVENFNWYTRNILIENI